MATPATITTANFSSKLTSWLKSTTSMRQGAQDIIAFGMPHNTLGNTIPDALFRSYGSECMSCPMEGHCLVDIQVFHDLFEISVSGLIG